AGNGQTGVFVRGLDQPGAVELLRPFRAPDVGPPELAARVFDSLRRVRVFAEGAAGRAASGQVFGTNPAELLQDRRGEGLVLVVALRERRALHSLRGVAGPHRFPARNGHQHVVELVHGVFDVGHLLARAPAHRGAHLEHAERVAITVVEVAQVRLGLTRLDGDLPGPRDQLALLADGDDLADHAALLVIEGAGLGSAYSGRQRGDAGHRPSLPGGLPDHRAHHDEEDDGPD